jgi:hypothetical protein
VFEGIIYVFLKITQLMLGVGCMNPNQLWTFFSIGLRASDDQMQ